jgi:REP element-mobilizing transposase RayT
MVAVEVMELHSAGAEQRPRFDYVGKHRYIVTLPTFQKQPIFAETRRCRAVLDALRDETLAAGFAVIAYVFLPDELTLLIRGEREDAHMKQFMGSFRSSSSAALEPELGHPLWKRVYRERVLRKTEESREIARQVFQIPVKRGLAPAAERYPMLGSFVASIHRLLDPALPGGRSRSHAQSPRTPPSGRHRSPRSPRRTKGS